VVGEKVIIIGGFCREIEEEINKIKRNFKFYDLIMDIINPTNIKAFE
jgi:hypothetical protein